MARTNVFHKALLLHSTMSVAPAPIDATVLTALSHLDTLARELYDVERGPKEAYMPHILRINEAYVRIVFVPPDSLR